MGVRAATFLAGRLLMHGANVDTPVTVVENVSRIDQRVIPTNIGALAGDIASANIEGPAILFLGLTPRKFNNLPLSDIADQIPLSATGTGG